MQLDGLYQCAEASAKAVWVWCKLSSMQPQDGALGHCCDVDMLARVDAGTAAVNTDAAEHYSIAVFTYFWRYMTAVCCQGRSLTSMWPTGLKRQQNT
jgi:hypothetical protein